MKVSKIWLILPILVMLLFIVGIYLVNANFNVEQSNAGYNYKHKLFDEDVVGTIDIIVSNENWQKILENPTAEEYVEATVKVNGENYNNVGIRAKGNSSLSSVANSNSERYSLKVDFSQYDSTQTFYGLEKINLNNNFSDTTQMKEFVSYELMEQLDIATPAHAYVKVNVNGNYYGLMLAVEEVGKAFAISNFGSTEGYIFKPEGNGSDLAYVSENVSDYSGIFNEVKMNKKTVEKYSEVITMMKEISEGDTSSLNIDQIARYFALNTALVNMDSYQGSFKHNYYLYENGDGIFSIIPWDYNMSFGGFNMGGGPQGNIPFEIGDQSIIQNGQQMPPMNEQQAPPTNGQMVPPNNTNGQRVPPTFGQMVPPGNTNGQMTPPDYINGQQVPSINGGARGTNMMLNETIVTDSSINFSITEPVSGTTVEELPLLKIILEDEEARSLYNSYLEKIATEILTEENVQAITSKLYDLLLNAVEEDPSKFSTTEQFIAGVSGEQSLPEFAKQRSASILKQLSGEIIGVSAVGTGFGGGNGNRPNWNGEMPNFGNRPNWNGQMPNFEKMPEMNGNEQVKVTNSKQMIIILIVSFMLIFLFMLIVQNLSNRKYRSS